MVVAFCLKIGKVVCHCSDKRSCLVCELDEVFSCECEGEVSGSKVHDKQEVLWKIIKDVLPNAPSIDSLFESLFKLLIEIEAWITKADDNIAEFGSNRVRCLHCEKAYLNWKFLVAGLVEGSIGEYLGKREDIYVDSQCNHPGKPLPEFIFVMLCSEDNYKGRVHPNIDQDIVLIENGSAVRYDVEALALYSPEERGHFIAGLRQFSPEQQLVRRKEKPVCFFYDDWDDPIKLETFENYRLKMEKIFPKLGLHLVVCKRRR